MALTRPVPPVVQMPLLVRPRTGQLSAAAQNSPEEGRGDSKGNSDLYWDGATTAKLTITESCNYISIQGEI